MITGTFNGLSIVALPFSYTTLSSVEFSMTDANAQVTSIFTGQTQIQSWPGADSLMGTMELPPLTQDQADGWVSFLAETRGILNAFMLGDPMKTRPKGHASGTPVVDMSSPNTNYTMAQTLYTKGWTDGVFGQLRPGDYIQLGVRLHRVLDIVSSDANGKASITIFPSIRETPTDGEAIITHYPQGLFRLATNKRTWSSDVTQLSRLSFQVVEAR